MILSSEFPLMIEEKHAMPSGSSIDPARLWEEQLSDASPDLLRQMLSTLMRASMSAEADAICGAPYEVPSPSAADPPARLTTTLDVLHQAQPDHEVRQARWRQQVADADRKLAQHRAALEAGAEPATIAEWTRPAGIATRTKPPSFSPRLEPRPTLSA